eukprot:COSAG01_NODE_54899_length_328_cov_0.586957_1_plen_33_part_10
MYVRVMSTTIYIIAGLRVRYVPYGGSRLQRATT